MSKRKNKLILLVAGGTGGHIFPAISTFYSLIKSYDITIISDKRGYKYFKDTIVKTKSKNQANIISYNSISPFNRGYFKKVTFLFLTVLAFFKFLYTFIKLKPQILLGFGGYVTVIPGFVAKILGIKIIIHEQNAIMGRANKILETIANYSLVSFKNTLPIKNDYKKRIYCGTPLRKQFYDKNFLITKNKRKGKFTILIFGGSLGSKFFSTEIPNAFCKLDNKLKKVLHLKHQVIGSKIKIIKNLYKMNKISAEVKVFFNKIINHYVKADLIICRAGGSSIAEIMKLKIPSIIIPLKESLDDHQVFNSHIIDKNRIGWVIKENEFQVSKFNLIIENLISNNKIAHRINENYLKLENNNSKLLKHKTPISIIENLISLIFNESNVGNSYDK